MARDIELQATMVEKGTAVEPKLNNSPDLEGKPIPCEIYDSGNKLHPPWGGSNGTRLPITTVNAVRAAS